MRPRFPITWLCLLLLAACLCAGCTTAKRTEYLHEPTRGLIDTLDLEQRKLEPFTHDGVVVWPLPRFRTTGTRIFFEAASKKPKPVTVKRARLSGIKEQASNSRARSEALSMPLDKQRRGVHISGATLFEIDNAELEILGAGGGLHLEVVFRVADAAKDITMEYDIERRVTTQLVSH